MLNAVVKQKHYSIFVFILQRLFYFGIKAKERFPKSIDISI